MTAEDLLRVEAECECWVELQRDAARDLGVGRTAGGVDNAASADVKRVVDVAQAAAEVRLPPALRQEVIRHVAIDRMEAFGNGRNQRPAGGSDQVEDAARALAAHRDF